MIFVKKLVIVLGLVASVGAHAATPALSKEVLTGLNTILNQNMFESMCKNAGLTLSNWKTFEKTASFSVDCGSTGKAHLSMIATQTTGDGRNGEAAVTAQVIDAEGGVSKVTGTGRFVTSKSGALDIELVNLTRVWEPIKMKNIQ